MGARFAISDLPATIRILTTAQRQAAAGGLTQPEVDLVTIASRRAALQREAAGSFQLCSSNQTDRSSPTGWAHEAASGQIDLSEQQQLDLFEVAAKGLTLERVNAVLRAQFSGEGPVIFLSTASSPPGGKAGVEAMLNRAERQRRLPPMFAPAAKPWTHTDFGAARAGWSIEERSLTSASPWRASPTACG